MGTGDNLREARERKLLKAAETLIERLGEAVLHVDEYIRDPADGEHYISELRFRVRYDAEGDVLGVIKAETGAGKVIAFQSGDTVAEVLRGIVNRLRNGSLQWREDKPYGEE